MKKTTFKIAVLSLLAAVIAAGPSQGFAQETKKEKPAAAKKDAPKGEKKNGRIPFNGKIAAVDKTAKTITVGERVFQITSETKLIKAGKPATLDDAAVGEQVGGSYIKTEDGKLNATTVRIGPKPDAPPKDEGKKKKRKED